MDTSPGVPTVFKQNQQVKWREDWSCRGFVVWPFTDSPEVKVQWETKPPPGEPKVNVYANRKIMRLEDIF